MSRRSRRGLNSAIRLPQSSSCRVRAWLAAHAQPKGYFELDTPTEANCSKDECAIIERPGSAIGSYKLLQIVGKGGMGMMFMKASVASFNNRPQGGIIELPAGQLIDQPANAVENKAVVWFKL